MNHPTESAKHNSPIRPWGPTQRLVWLGGQVFDSNQGLVVHHNQGEVLKHEPRSWTGPLKSSKLPSQRPQHFGSTTHSVCSLEVQTKETSYWSPFDKAARGRIRPKEKVDQNVSLRDQLLKAGLVDKKRVQKANRDLKKARRQKQSERQKKRVVLAEQEAERTADMVAKKKARRTRRQQSEARRPNNGGIWFEAMPTMPTGHQLFFCRSPRDPF